jgi:hypothetical protein
MKRLAVLIFISSCGDSMADDMTPQDILRAIEAADCYCSRQIEEGVTGPSGIVCTGAEAPTLLRHRNKDPCSGDWDTTH